MSDYATAYAAFAAANPGLALVDDSGIERPAPDDLRKKGTVALREEEHDQADVDPFVAATARYTPEQTAQIYLFAKIAGVVRTVRHFETVASKLVGLDARNVLRRVLNAVPRGRLDDGIDPEDFLRASVSAFLRLPPGDELDELVAACRTVALFEAREAVRWIRSRLRGHASGAALLHALELTKASTRKSARRARCSHGAIVRGAERIRKKLSNTSTATSAANVSKAA